MNFLGLLSKLNASQHSIQKVASFAMRHRSMHEDLYNCIIEALDQVTIIFAFFTLLSLRFVLSKPIHKPPKLFYTHGPLDLKEQRIQNEDRDLGLINTTFGPGYFSYIRKTFQLTGHNSFRWRLSNNISWRGYACLTESCCTHSSLSKERMIVTSTKNFARLLFSSLLHSYLSL